ncbi:MAG: heme-binding protein [Ilumatobacteraceae bacterium]|nr:heme-binding protein [Ilumatobacteraceae bacterium]
MPHPDVVAMNTLSMWAAQRIADAAIAAASSGDVAACIAVCDPSGAAIITVRMDGAPRLSAEVALNKAYSVAAFNGMPTDKWWPLLADDPALVHGFTHTDRLVVFAGGVPVLVDGEVVGAVGVSGGSAEQDRQIAQAGADAVGTS